MTWAAGRKWMWGSPYIESKVEVDYSVFQGPSECVCVCVYICVRDVCPDVVLLAVALYSRAVRY